MPAIGQEKLEFHRCFRILQTSAEMMSDRKYKVAQHVVPGSLHEFVERYVEEVDVTDGGAGATPGMGEAPRRRQQVIRRDKMTLACERVVGEGSTLKAVVYFCPPNHLSSDVVKKIAEDALSEGYQRVVFVTPTRPNPIVRKTMDTYNRGEQDLRFELFEEDEICVNITHHELVPKHTPLSEEELSEVLHAHALELSQLPRILSTDPVARYYGLERGQVVRIERRSMSAGLYVTYRQRIHMTSIEELKAVRLFRALNTMIQLCHDRGYVIRHPSAIAEAVQNPELYDTQEGLDYDWFLRRFVISPERVTGSSSSIGGGGSGSGSSTKKSGGGGARRATADNEEEEALAQEKGADLDDAVDEAEAVRRAANGEWVCMRNAMRLTCSIDPSRLSTLPPHASTNESVVVNNKPKKEAPAGAAGSVVKAEPEDADGDVPLAATAVASARRKEKAAKNALVVFFSGAPKLSIKEVQACREKALKKRAASMIIVTNKVDPGVRLDVQELSGRMDEATGAELLSIQVFEEEALAFNVVRHETVPHHAALTPAESEAFLKERKLSIAQLPRMLESDPLVQYLGLQRGSIVHVTREGKQSGPYSMYRHVI